MNRLDDYWEAVKGDFLDREDLLRLAPLQDIEAIAPIFDKPLTYKEFCNLKMILCQKYIVEYPEDVLKDLDIGKLALPLDSRVLYIMGGKTEVLDVSRFEHLEKLFLADARKVKRIILPKCNCLKALGLSGMTNLEEIENISVQKGLRYLHFERKIGLARFDFIKNLNQLLYLSFTNIKTMPELDFISPDSQLRFLDFVATNVFKHSSIAEQLKKLKCLRFLTTGTTNQKQREFLRTQLPHICMREG